ncbi:ATP synthase subunit I [Hydrogenophaga sp. BPS33]|uniref:ATP synthase subunit I n=1 Tax=Hydrogenophaga sp. BPS33 TaxID=2651974 RepID=UPI001358392A|nr:ATP synthase subunit I [Hydrogenophaga sp. BPS33]
MTQSHSIPPDKAGQEDGEQDSDFKPLTVEQARQWRAGQPVLPLWRLVLVQCFVGLIASIVGGLLWQSSAVAWSVLYGAASVAIPSALMAYGLTSSAMSRVWASHANAAFAGFLLWEGVKILLAVVMLAVAPWVVASLNWLGLLVGLVLVLKVYWFGWLIQSRRSHANG